MGKVKRISITPIENGVLVWVHQAVEKIKGVTLEEDVTPEEKSFYFKTYKAAFNWLKKEVN